MKDWIVGIWVVFLIFATVLLEGVLNVKIFPMLVFLTGVFIVFIGLRIIIYKKAYWPGFKKLPFLILRKIPSSINNNKDFKPIVGKKAIILGFVYVLLGLLIVFLTLPSIKP